jgi:hypothetical protein
MVLVREYNSIKEFEKDANKLAKQGYAPTNTVRQPGHLGTKHKNVNIAVGVLTGGLGLLVARTSERLIVTYTRATAK